MCKQELVAQLSCAALALETLCTSVVLLQTSQARLSEGWGILKATYINTSNQWTCQYCYVLQGFVSAPPAHSLSTLGEPSNEAQQQPILCPLCLVQEATAGAALGFPPHTGHTNAATAKLPSPSISIINYHSSSCCWNHNLYLVFNCIMCSWFTRHYLRKHTNNSSLSSILPIRASKQARLILVFVCF